MRRGIGPAGTLQRQLDFSQPPADALAAGSTRYMQRWYRDPNGPGGSGFNLSDAVQVTFSP